MGSFASVGAGVRSRGRALAYATAATGVALVPGLALAQEALPETAQKGIRTFLQAALETWTFEVTRIEGAPLTVGTILIAAALLPLGFVLSRYLSRGFGGLLTRRLSVEIGAATALETVSFYALLVGFTLFALRLVNFPLTAFTILGGALAIGIGFGSQNVMNNFISGLILMLERPVRLGDLVEVEGTHGTVERIGARSTRIRASDSTHIVVPNSFFLESNLVNWTLSDDTLRCQVNVGVIYGSPTRQATELIQRALETQPGVLRDPQPQIIFADFGDNALCFEIYFWVRARSPMERRRFESDIRFQIDDLFREAGLVIAFPQRDVQLDSAAPVEVRLVGAEDRS